MADVTSVKVLGLHGVGLGVWWYVWSLYGFWWGVLYGAFWPIWVGYRMAAYLLSLEAFLSQ